MVHAKNYEIVSTFVKVMQKKTLSFNSGLFFSGHGVECEIRGSGMEIGIWNHKTTEDRAL